MSVAPPPNLRTWTRAEYHRAYEAGIIGPEERVELVDGQIVNKMPQNPRHAVAIRLISRLFERLFGETRDIRVQLPIVLSDLSEPEPDLVVVKGTAVDYLDDHPHPEQIELLVEVCDSTAERDRRRKIPLYAASSIKEVWLVDLTARRLEAYQEPLGKGIRPHNDPP